MIVERRDKNGKKTGIFDVRLRNEFGKMQYFTCGTTRKTLAREYEAKLKEQIREWKIFPERKIKQAAFGEFVNEYYLPKHAKSLREKTQFDYKSICKKLVAEFGQISMEAVERLNVDNYLTRRYGQVSVYMANREFAVLKGIFTKAESWGFRRKGSNPCKAQNNGEKMKLKKEEARLRIFTTAEIDRLLSECKRGSGEFREDEFEET